MKRRVALYFAALAAVSLAGVARSADLIGSVYSSAYDTPDQRRNLRGFAQCIAAKYPEQVQEALRLNEIGQNFRTKYPQMYDLHCFSAAFFKNKSMVIDSDFYGALLSEYLLLTDYHGRPIPDLTKVAPLRHSGLPRLDLASIPTKYRDEFVESWAQHDFGVAAECVVRANPGQALALLQVAPGSDAEGPAIAAVISAFAGCRAPDGFAGLRHHEVRGLIAQNLYLLLDGAQPVPHAKSITRA